MTFKSILTGLLGFVLGILATLLVRPALDDSQRVAVQSEIRASQTATTDLQAELLATQSQFESARADLRAVRRKTDDRSAATTAAKESSPPTMPAMSSAAIESANLMMGVQSEQRRLALTNRLDLTPDQQTRLASFLEAEQERMSKMTARIRSGERLSMKELNADDGALIRASRSL